MIETRYPGVYVAEIAFSAHPIEGVPTTPQPDWTDAGTHDPGVTLLELLAWTADALSFGLAAQRHERWHGPFDDEA